MPIVIKVAQETQELSDVLRVRFLAVKESGQLVSQHYEATESMIDHFDVFPTTVQMIAYLSGQPVGTVRAVEYEPSHILQNQSYDFSQSFRNLEAPTSLVDILALCHSILARWDRLWVLHEILQTLFLELHRRGRRYAYLWVEEKILSGFAGSAKALSDQGRDGKLPWLVDLNHVFSQFVEKTMDQEILRFQDVFYKTLFAPGEILIVEGERGSTSFLIETGEVEVVSAAREEVIPIKKISAGHLVGEIAMVTNEPRTASILATMPTSCVSFDRGDFMRQMFSEPAKSIDIFRIFGKRIQEANQRYVQLQNEKIQTAGG